MFNDFQKILSLGNFISHILFGPILVFSLSTPFWLLYIFITDVFFLKIKDERFLNFLINLVSIIFGLILLLSIFSLDENNELNMMSYLLIFLQIILITFLTWIIKVDRGYIKTGSSRPDILDDDLGS